MKLTKLFEIQAAFESAIIENTSIKEDALGEENIRDILFLALNVKLGELANLTKCYKYNQVKPNLPKHKLVIRYTDVLRYLLSTGNKHQFNMIQWEDLNHTIETQDAIQIFSKLFDDLTTLKKAVKSDQYVQALNDYIRIFSYFIHLGAILGLTESEIQEHFDSLSEM